MKFRLHWLLDFRARRWFFAGVGKADKEIITGLENNIGCFNVESIPELEIINEIAERMGEDG